MNKVVVTVEGRQKDAMGEESCIKMVAEGRHFYKNGQNYILYEEGEAAETGKVSTMLKIAGDSMTLLRRGAIAQEQHFARGKVSKSMYRTPYGALDLSIRTQSIKILYGSVSGHIEIVYQLSMNGKWQSDNELHIDICAASAETNNLN